jgi:Hypoxia induced protein conserved region
LPERVFGSAASTAKRDVADKLGGCNDLAISSCRRPTAGTYPAQREGGYVMDVLTTLLLIAMLATLGALVVGVAGFFRGGEFNRKYSNKLMQARVVLQAVAVVLLLMLLLGVGQG